MTEIVKLEGEAIYKAVERYGELISLQGVAKKCGYLEAEYDYSPEGNKKRWASIEMFIEAMVSAGVDIKYILKNWETELGGPINVSSHYRLTANGYTTVKGHQRKLPKLKGYKIDGTPFPIKLKGHGINRNKPCD